MIQQNWLFSKKRISQFFNFWKIAMFSYFIIAALYKNFNWKLIEAPI